MHAYAQKLGKGGGVLRHDQNLEESLYRPKSLRKKCFLGVRKTHIQANIAYTKFDAG